MNRIKLSVGIFNGAVVQVLRTLMVLFRCMASLGLCINWAQAKTWVLMVLFRSCFGEKELVNKHTAGAADDEYLHHIIWSNDYITKKLKEMLVVGGVNQTTEVWSVAFNVMKTYQFPMVRCWILKRWFSSRNESGDGIAIAYTIGPMKIVEPKICWTTT